MTKPRFNPDPNEPLQTDTTSRIWFKRSVLGTVALGSGVAAALIANYILEEKMTALETSAREITARKIALHTIDKSTENKISVIVAKTFIAPGTRLGKHNLTERAIPEQWTPSYALTGEEFIQLENKISAYLFQPGDIITPPLVQTNKHSRTEEKNRFGNNPALTSHSLVSSSHRSSEISPSSRDNNPAPFVTSNSSNYSARSILHPHALSSNTGIPPLQTVPAAEKVSILYGGYTGPVNIDANAVGLIQP